MSRTDNIVGMPPGSRCQRIVRLRHAWMLWVSTNDYKHGTYLLLCDTGEVVRVTVRDEEGDEHFLVRPADTNPFIH